MTLNLVDKECSLDDDADWCMNVVLVNDDPECGRW